MNLTESRFVYSKVESANFVVRASSLLLSSFYLLMVSIRNWLFDFKLRVDHHLPGKVISVGNIAVGGTGKTPVVMEIAAYMHSHGARPVILTRGYGSGLQKKQWIVMLAGKMIGGNHTAASMPDEGRLQSVECPKVPVIAGPARFLAAKAYLQGLNGTNLPTHWILDDGFQHRQIHRDYDVVLLDKQNPFGNRFVIPYGFLREPVSSLRRASHLILTGENGNEPLTADELVKLFPNISVDISTNVAANLGEDVLQNVFFNSEQHLPALLVAGIARPERLRRDLKNAGVVCIDELILPDHATIEIEEITRRIQSVRSVVTTAKDYWRNPEVFHSLKIPVFIKKLRIMVPESLLATFL